MRFFTIIAAASAIAINQVADYPMDDDALELGEGPSADEIMGFCDTNKNGRLSFWEGKRCIKKAVRKGELSKEAAGHLV